MCSHVGALVAGQDVVVPLSCLKVSGLWPVPDECAIRSHTLMVILGFWIPDV